MSINTKRLIAFFLDYFAITLIAGALVATPINPYYDDELKLQEEMQEITEEYSQKMLAVPEDSEKESDSKELLAEYREVTKPYSHELAKKSVFDVAITTTLMLLYYVVFAHFFDGQTVGKRIMKLRIETPDGNRVKWTGLLIRTVLLYTIPYSLLTTLLSYILNTNTFNVAYNVLYWLNFAFEIALIISIFTKEDHRGIHDMLAGTKVEKVEETVMRRAN